MNIEDFRTFFEVFNRSITDIHPNARGLGVLARAYIDRIHGRYFDPHSPN